MNATMNLEDITVFFTDDLKKKEGKEITFKSLDPDYKYCAVIEIRGKEVFDVDGASKESLGNRLLTMLEGENDYKVFVETYYRGPD